MSFLSKENSDLLYEVIRETMNVDYASFNKSFLEFGQINGNSLPLMEMNKQFIRSFLVSSGMDNTPQSYPQRQSQSQSQQTSMPFRPQGARSKNVSFDEQLELHKQHFQQFAVPPPPTPPNFKDEDPEPVINLDILMQKALSDRKYDPMPPPPPVRKLHIGSVIEDMSIKEDIIDVDKFNNKVERKLKEPEPEPEPDTVPSVNTFFSKLQQLKPAKPLAPLINPDTIDVDKPINKLTQDIQHLTDTVNKLEKEIETIKQTISQLQKNIYNEELKETPTIQNIE
jgi:hypothetical protein